MQVKELMTRDVISVSPETPVSKIAEILTTKRIHGLPVVENNKLLGIITESDFFIKGLPAGSVTTYVNLLQKLEEENNLNDKQMDDIQKLKKSTAKDVMSADCLTVSKDQDVNDLIKLFKEKRLFTFPVVDNEKNLVGVVTQADIIKMMMTDNF